METKLLFSALAFASLLVSTAQGLPGSGVGQSGEKRVLDISLNSEVDPLRGSLGSYKLVSADGRVSVLDSSGAPVYSDTPTFSRTDAVDAEFFALQYLAILKSKFGRDGLDGRGTPISILVGSISATMAPDACTGEMHDFDAVPDAAWINESHLARFSGATPWTLSYGSSPTIVTHELTHGVTASTSGLGTDGESGALNEAFSDIMAQSMTKAIAPKSFNWTMGSEVQKNLKCQGTRSLSHPRDSIFWLPDASGSKTVRDHFRDHVSDLYTGKEDAHGVHINSSIPALAFYLLSEGGVHPRASEVGRVQVKGVGLDLATSIFFQAFTQGLKSDAKFADAREATVRVGRGISADVGASVEAAWAAVGVK